MTLNNTPIAVHVDEYLTGLTTDYYRAQNYLADRVFPVVEVSKLSDKYYVFDAEESNRDNSGLVTKAAPLTLPNMVEVTQSEDTYFCELHHLGFYMEAQTDANEDEILRSRQRKARATMNALMQKRDRDWIEAYFSTGIWGIEKDGSGADFVQWSDAASTPIQDILNWKEEFEIKNYGAKPNKLVITRDIRNHLLNNTQILGRINGGATVANPAMVNDTILASIFEVEEIVWADAVVNTAARGATESAQRMVSNRLLFVNTPSDVGIDTPAAGLTFAWNALEGYRFGITAQTFSGPEFAARGIKEQVHVGMNYDMKVTGANLGLFANNVVA